MGRASKTEKLPPEIRSELNRRLVDSGFSGYSELSDWLRGLGFDVSKSAIHRYAMNIEGVIHQKDVGDLSLETDLRMRCSEATASFYKEGDLVQLSSELYFWVTTGSVK